MINNSNFLVEQPITFTSNFYGQPIWTFIAIAILGAIVYAFIWRYVRIGWVK